MRRTIGIAASALLLSTTGSPADAMMVFVAADVVCQGVSVTDITREAGWQVGVVTGAVEKAVPGTLTCRIYVNGQPRVSVSSHTVGAGGVQVAVVADEVAYPATAADSVTLCAIFQPGVQEWWDPGPLGSLGTWRTTPVDPSRCRGLQVEPNDPECPLLKSVDSRLRTDLAEIWQDCEPYSPII
jgi:hypothetical protein